MTHCTQCKKEFETTEADRLFYQKMDVPEPAFCAPCRQQRRLAWRNERSLYPRKCAHTGANVISIYSPESPWPVLAADVWYGDTWDQLVSGRDFDFSRPFFEQYKELQAVAPHLCSNVVNNENSPFINHGWNNKGCYMCFDLGYCENCYYCSAVYHAKETVDSMFVYADSELCYECVGISKCYRCAFLEDCHVCSNAIFSVDCKNCSDIILCSNLRNKQYCILNKQFTKEGYEEEKKKYDLRSYAHVEEMKKEFVEVRKRAIRRFSHNQKSEGCHGDYLSNCKDLEQCFDAEKSELCTYATRLDSDVKDCMDLDHAAEGELMYQGVAVSGYMLRSVYHVVHCQNVEYSESLINCNNCFGCVHVHNQEYCILNKKYSKEEYEALREKIVEHMKKTGEWGQFFSPSVAPFGYNETTANEYYSLTKEEALAHGFHWQDNLSFVSGRETQSLSSLPDMLTDQNSISLVGHVYACGECGRNFKLIKQEVALYLKLGVPAPRKCFDCRYTRRFLCRNPRVLYARQCMCEKIGHDHTGRCAEQFETTYAPDRPEFVYCEGCYQKEII